MRKKLYISIFLMSVGARIAYGATDQIIPPTTPDTPTELGSVSNPQDDTSVLPDSATQNGASDGWYWDDEDIELA